MAQEKFLSGCPQPPTYLTVLQCTDRACRNPHSLALLALWISFLSLETQAHWECPTFDECKHQDTQVTRQSTMGETSSEPTTMTARSKLSRIFFLETTRLRRSQESTLDYVKWNSLSLVGRSSLSHAPKGL